MDCLREPDCHLEVVHDPRSLEVAGVILFIPDKEPGVVSWRDIDLPDLVGGENGRTCLDEIELEKQAAASEGVTNQRKAAASGGKATVWSGIVSLAASLSAEARTTL